MLEAAKVALEKAGFTIKKLQNRIKELEAENAELKEQKTCNGCLNNDDFKPINIDCLACTRRKRIDNFILKTDE